MPTTSAIAGTVSGSRQMNSTTRLIRGRRRRTHTIVGRTRTSMSAIVIAASSSEATIASVNPVVLVICVHASSVRGALMLLPRVENSNMAPIGTRKNAPRTTKTTTRKAWSLTRRDLFTLASAQPLRGSPLQQGVERHHDQHDHDHGEREGLGEARLARTCLAGERRLDLQWNQHAALGEEGRRRRVRGERVGEQEERAPQEGGQ